MTRTIIISGGSLEEKFILSYLKKEKYDRLIVADRGLQFCHEHGIKPDEILGDFDSLPKGILQDYEEMKEHISVYNPQKDATDTQLAVEKAIEMKSDEIILLGATGTRLDHVLGNFQVLYETIQQGISCYLLDGHNKITILKPGRYMLERKNMFGTYISFLPYTDEVVGLTLEGFLYPLKEYTMEKNNSLGVSNELYKDCGVISFQKGALFMIQSQD